MQAANKWHLSGHETSFGSFSPCHTVPNTFFFSHLLVNSLVVISCRGGLVPCHGSDVIQFRASENIYICVATMNDKCNRLRLLFILICHVRSATGEAKSLERIKADISIWRWFIHFFSLLRYLLFFFAFHKCRKKRPETRDSTNKWVLCEISFWNSNAIVYAKLERTIYNY